jgi:TPP-dependent pyruvate/acetoin dehydrogenase alpha subunit
LSDVSDIQHEQLLRMHRDMLRIRMVEEGIAERYAEQEMRCPVHLSIGQEAAAVGVCHALLHTDRVFSTHRCHAHYLAMDGDLKAMLAEIYGKAAGCVGGRGGSMHLTDPAKGLIASVPIVASSIPLAVGTALADQIDGKPNVSVAFFGDASVEEGVFHESANFASLRKLPVLFVCENNLYSVYTPLKDRQPPRKLTELARAHGMSFASADGNDVVAVFEAAQQAVERARRGDGPTFLLFDTYRWREHCGPAFDNHIGYRSEAEYEAWHSRCPIEASRRELQGRKLLTPADEAALVTKFKREIDEAFEFAKAAPLPEPSWAAAHVYA